MSTVAFAHGVDAVAGYGDRWVFSFSDTWTITDQWTMLLATSTGNITLGGGNLSSALNQYTTTAQVARFVFTYRNRVYIVANFEFLFSDNSDPTGWEDQNSGAGFVKYLSQFGGQDTLYSLSQLQGRLVVVARRSVQIWTVDADPQNFSLVQTMDNIGTQYPQSVQNLGDYDVLILDDTGVRSLRSREVTLNAVVDDVGLPIDSFIQADMAAVGGGLDPNVCSVVEPSSKRYWLAINGKIYVLSRYPSSKITAWTTYICTDSNGATFTPKKFVVYNGKVYCRSSERKFLTYGGANGVTYDSSVVTITLPWLNHGKPITEKTLYGIDAAMKGAWTIKASADPYSSTLETVIAQGSTSAPNELTDSTYDWQNFAFNAMGTHVQLNLVSGAYAKGATLSAVIIKYTSGEKK